MRARYENVCSSEVYDTTGGMGWEAIEGICKEFDNPAEPDCLREAALLYDLVGGRRVRVEGGNK